jgi:hypothetical protein
MFLYTVIKMMISLGRIRNSKVRYRAYKHLPVDSIVSQTNPVHVQLNVFNVLFNIISHISALVVHMVYSGRLSNLYAFLATCATCPAHLIVFDVALIIFDG